MKLLFISLFFSLFISQSVWASPITSTDIKNQKNIELIKRTIKQDLVMTVDKMLDLVKQNNLEFEHKNNTISINVNGFNLIVIYDTNADRMRIVCPIIRVEDLEQGQMQQALDANFHTALDARYAISDEIVWSVFVHPLSDLSEKLFQSALQQTLIAAATFGKEYSSGSFSFPDTKKAEEEAVESEEVQTKEDKNNN